MVAVFAIFGMRKIKSKALLITVAVAGVNDFGGSAEGGLMHENSEGRLHAWEATISAAVQRPLTGVGLNNCVAAHCYYSDWWEGFAKAVDRTFGRIGLSRLVDRHAERRAWL
jgi:putative inorganic carbon (hco3(-)) transporter